ncbi:Acetyl esterase [Lachnellula cervina]|uniref:Acetyl esterase n=1 Tax=Lachnellula cervina TaxID=1316786 RepID=A0A7D8YUI3_9HELO|nr:Acetyl esterase [Lachnellula cervina]
MPDFNIKVKSATPLLLDAREATMKNVEAMCRGQPQWYSLSSVAEYRKKRAEGLDGFVSPALYSGAKTVYIAARDGHQIELRIIQPPKESKGVLLHFHAGGFVIGSCKSYDNYLLHLANTLQVTAVSVEYRLAPENPYPAAHHDALDAAHFALSPEGENILGSPLRILAGESAGGSLATWVALALRDQGVNVRSKIACILSSYPIYDLTYTPSLLGHKREAILSSEGMRKFVDTAFPDMSLERRKDGNVSSLYAELSGMPPALFLCGTEDPLLDDSVFMGSKWAMAGNESEVLLVPGAWHAFTLIPAGEVTDEGLGDLVQFASKHLK